MFRIKMSKTLSIFVALLVAGSLMTAPVANAAYTVTPKVGQCFQYTKAQVSAKYAPKNPINCSSTHNMETYRVAKWPFEANPTDMDRQETIDTVYELCDFFGTFPEARNNWGSTTKINYWAWYTPSPAGWAKGQRWLRCDAMIGKFTSAEEWPPLSHVSWKGLKTKKN
jgi:hypothetical protein